jgi:hypothetical protein
MDALRSYPGAGCPVVADRPPEVADRSVDRRSMLYPEVRQSEIPMGGNRYSGQVSVGQPWGIGTYAGSATADGWCCRCAAPGAGPGVSMAGPSTRMGDNAVITGLTAAIVAARPSRSRDQKGAAFGLCDAADGPCPVPHARQVSCRAIAASVGRRPLPAGRPVIRFIMGGCR